MRSRLAAWEIALVLGGAVWAIGLVILRLAGG